MYDKDHSTQVLLLVLFPLLVSEGRLVKQQASYHLFLDVFDSCCNSRLYIRRVVCVNVIGLME